jgi:hypothetical protein
MISSAWMIAGHPNRGQSMADYKLILYVFPVE